MENNKKILFILKNRSLYGISYGLKNSCQFIANTLNKLGFNCKVVEVIDTTFIDKEVHEFRPDYVIFEALWAETARLPQIFNLHPKVKKWTARIHSKSSFLVNEGNALNMINQYDSLSKEYPNFSISANNYEFLKEIYYSTGIKLDYLPNIYPFKNNSHSSKDGNKKIIDIGCFGSLRPLKNQLIQAMAAIEFADRLGKKLKFHINHDRQEQNGQNVLKNLVALFENNKNHELVFHGWSNHAEFIGLVKQMDIGMQVSYNESYNIVAADFVSNNIPIVVSDEIKFVFPIFRADFNSIDDMISKLDTAYLLKPFKIHHLNKILLNSQNHAATKEWLEFIE